jgi:hypothetical protein
MRFEELLATCIEELAQGSSVEECLARHPKQAESLAPLLRLAASLQTNPRLHYSSRAQLSSRAFQRGRAALTEAAQAQQPLPVTAYPPVGSPVVAHRNGAQVSGHTALLRRDRHRAPQRRKRPAIHLYQALTLVVTLVLLLASAAVLELASTSTPRSPFYTLRMTSERAQGVLMTAAGEGATWHAQQTLRRLYDLAAVVTADAASPASAEEIALRADLAQQATAHLDQAIKDGSALPQPAQQRFFAEWLLDLERTETWLQQSTVSQEVALALVQRAISQVNGVVATPLPDETVTSAPTAAVTDLATATVAPPTTTATPQSPTNTLQPTATRVLRPTPVPTAEPVLQALPRITATPPLADTPLPVITQVIRREAPASEEEQEQPTAPAGSTPAAETNDESENAETADPGAPSSSNDDGNDDGADSGEAEETPATATTEQPTTATPTADGAEVTATITGEPTTPSPTTTPEPTGEPVGSPATPTPLLTPADAETPPETPSAPGTDLATVVAETAVPGPTTVAPIIPGPAPTDAVATPTNEVRPTRTRRPTATPAPTAPATEVTPPPVAPTEEPTADGFLP